MSSAETPKWACMYPGQGSQAVGMGRTFFENFQFVKHRFEEASDTLKTNFKQLCFEGPEEELTLTENTQPALLLISVTTFEILAKEYGALPVIAAGHSVGEYAACVNSRVLSFSDALRAVRLRGQSMQAAVPKGLGAMAAVMGLEPEQVERLCAWSKQKNPKLVLEPANFNAPGQIVISGHAEAVTWLQGNLGPESLREVFQDGSVSRVKLIPLKVSAPFHCSLMAPAEDKMRGFLQDLPFVDAIHPIVQNFTALAQSGAKDIRENLIRQISGPVRWIESVPKLAETASFAIECGHGQVLKGLAKKLVPNLVVHSLNSMDDFRNLKPHLEAH
jgi:[acyl-carrier-protein] S-malonyltransferase